MTVAETPTQPATAGRAMTKLLHVGWMSVLVGIFFQLVNLVLMRVDGLAAFVRDASGKISWAMFVCIGIALATAASKSRPLWMGFAGLLAAPAAIIIARATQRSIATALGVGGGAGAAGALLAALILIKAIEYGAFGLLLGRLSRREPRKLSQYLLLGAGAGIVFGSVILLAVRTLSPTPPGGLQLVAIGFNEMLFPSACALVIYAAETLGVRTAR